MCDRADTFSGTEADFCCVELKTLGFCKRHHQTPVHGSATIPVDGDQHLEMLHTINTSTPERTLDNLLPTYVQVVYSSQSLSYTCMTNWPTKGTHEAGYSPIYLSPPPTSKPHVPLRRPSTTPAPLHSTRELSLSLYHPSETYIT